MTVQQAFALAQQHHQAGRLAEAEALYRQILAVKPNDAEAWHLLGIIGLQSRRFEFAAELIGRAVTLDASSAEAYSNLGEAFRLVGKLDDAVTAFRQALSIQPKSA